MGPASLSCTNDISGGFLCSSTPLSLIPGPTWNGFEDIRKGGVGALRSIPPCGVATLNSKAGSFRVIRSDDFQRLLGIASEVNRLQAGLKIVLQAVKVYVKDHDKDAEDLLLQSVSFLAQSPMLPERKGHEAFRLSQEELESSQSEDDFDVLSEDIPTPKL